MLALHEIPKLSNSWTGGDDRQKAEFWKAFKCFQYREALSYDQNFSQPLLHFRHNDALIDHMPGYEVLSVLEYATRPRLSDFISQIQSSEGVRATNHKQTHPIAVSPVASPSDPSPWETGGRATTERLGPLDEQAVRARLPRDCLREAMIYWRFQLPQCPSESRARKT
jgi:hypothetical protein